MPSRVALGVAVWSWAMAICGAAAAEGLPSPAPLAPLRLDLGAVGAVIVVPGSTPYQGIAAELRRGIEQSTGRSPRIVPDSTEPTSLGAGPILVLGNLMDSRLARRLYLEAYDFMDYSWPSPGGCAVRTIRDPFGTGAHAIVVGGSDLDGVKRAAAVLIERIKNHGPNLGYFHQVRLGRFAAEIETCARELLDGDDRVWHRSGGSGSWDYQIQIAKAAIGYLRTGNEAYLPVFKRELRSWFDRDVRRPKGDAPQMLHGFLHTILVPWDLVRDHPSFSDAERQAFDADFLRVFLSPEGPGRIEAASRRTVVRDNHGTRTGLDAFFGGRYFSRRFGLKEAQRWLEIADRYFAAQMASAKPVEDSWGHQWAASLDNTLVYAMAKGKQEYFRSAAFRSAADRALVAHGHGKTPLGYMAACAVAAGDTGYLSGHGDRERVARRCAAMSESGDEYLRSFSTPEPIVPRRDLLGVAVAPLDALWQDTIDVAGFNVGGLFVATAARADRFDKISLREGWDNDFYLLLDGISGGHHAYQDGNCIVAFEEGGVAWSDTGRRNDQSATVRSQNGVFLALDGAGPSQLHRFARRLYAGQSGEYLAAAVALEGVGPCDWRRHVLRKRGKWTLVIDQALTKQPGELLAERHWRLRGRIQARPDGLTCTQSGVCLHLQSAGLSPDGMRGTEDRKEVLRTLAAPGQPIEIATLLQVSRTPDRWDARLAQAGPGWRIESLQPTEFVMVDRAAGTCVSVVTDRGVTTVGLPSADKPPTYAEFLATRPSPPKTLPLSSQSARVAIPWRTLNVGQSPVTAVAASSDGRVAAGDRTGTVAVFGPDGQRRTVAKLASPILSLHFIDGDLLVGEDRGALSRLDDRGQPRWQLVIPYIPMAWPYWSEEKSRIREIDSADLDGDGRSEILVANADRRVYAITADGKELWRASVEWGVYTAMTVGQLDKTPALLGGTSRPAMHGWCIAFGSTGKLLRHYARPDLVSWSIPCQFRDLRLADLDGDGAAEIINAIDTNCRQLIAYRADGRLLWDADLAGAANALAVMPPEGGRPAVVCAASDSGYVGAFDGPNGRRRWACFLGEPAHYLAVWESRKLLAATPSGKVFVIDENGNVTGHEDFGASVTGLLRPGDHRAGNQVLLGTSDGRVRVLPVRVK